jgi:hypothetical protein
MQMEILINNEDGSTTKFTEDMAVTAIKERDQLRKDLADKTEWNSRHSDRIASIRGAVYDFFVERHETSETKITCTVDDVNDLLSSIGANKLKRLFTITGQVNFVITDVEADDEDDANDIVNNELQLEFGGDGNLDDWDVDIRDTNEQ